MAIVNLTNLASGLSAGRGAEEPAGTLFKNAARPAANLKNPVLSIDNLSLSDISKRVSREMSVFRKNVAEETSRALTAKEVDDLVSAEYLSEFIKAGKKIEKPSASLDDLTWGMLVSVGEKIGVDDPDMLMELTVRDLEAYFYETEIAGKAASFAGGKRYDAEGEEIKGYASAGEFWSAVFSKDADGKITRNPDFTISLPEAPAMNNPTKFFSPNGDKKLIDLSADSLHNFLLSMESGDAEAFKYSARTASKATAENRGDLTAAREEIRSGYELLRRFMKNAPTMEEQENMLKTAVISGLWKTFKPYAA